MDENKENRQDTTPKFRGLYRHVKISVKALDWIIVSCIVVIIVATIIGLQNPGYTVTFDTRGGTDVAAVTQDYDTPLQLPPNPTREGYTFAGWYKDPQCIESWNTETDRVVEDVTLYAAWTPNQ